MTSALEDLLAVQDLDTRADQLRHRRANLPEQARLTELARLLQELERTVAALSAQREELAAKEHVLDERAQADQARRNEIARRLKSSTVPKEVQALSAEQAQLEAHQRTLEDQELELMEAIEPLDTQLAELMAQRDSLDAQTVAVRVALAEAQVAVEAETESVAVARREALARVPAELVAQYDSMRPRLGGVAIARLEGGRCLGCHLQIPAIELDRIRHEPPDTVVTCEQCGRILVR